MAETYICAYCKKNYLKAWTDEEAEKEKIENFGDVPLNECVIVCDYCYEMIKNSLREKE